jgi:hypothetical protein
MPSSNSGDEQREIAAYIDDSSSTISADRAVRAESAL